MCHKRIFVPNQTSDMRGSLPDKCPNDRMCHWEEQNMWRLVTVNLSVDFRIFKPDDVRKRELLVKKGRNASLQKTQRYGALRMTTICTILSGFRKVLIGNTIVTCLQTSHRTNKMTFSNWCLFLAFIEPGAQCYSCFISNIWFSHKEDRL